MSGLNLAWMLNSLYKEMGYLVLSQPERQVHFVDFVTRLLRISYILCIAEFAFFDEGPLAEKTTGLHAKLITMYAEG
ncbi:unnamed protein product [Gongylonema pulchrum]|uniref:Uncharacterized protein n=1 Tax=Gongylonema pulchrum TaxID=637853 RepID=A0A183EN38_9BILA|nr:unnamed protein product [Gongylonema pulchrum]